MQNEKYALFGIIIAVLLLNIYVSFKNPDCPFHVDYVQYAEDIEDFYENNIIGSNVNGKYIYVYLMGILIKPFYSLGLGIYDGMVLMTGIFQVVLIWLFYRYTKSLLKTMLMSTTLTFLTFIGHAETIMPASVFLMLYFINRDKPYSEFFIAIASLIRLDFAVYYLFARKKTAFLPVAITGLQWLSGRPYFLNSDFGINPHPFSALFVFLLGFGFYFLLFAFAKFEKARKWDYAALAFIVIFFIFFLKFPSQKVFFFPVMLSFMLIGFDFGKKARLLIIALAIVNILFGLTGQYYRSNICTPNEFYGYAISHDESIFFGVFQPYLDYRERHYSPPFDYQITANCNSADYFIAEDWRNAQLLFIPYKFCIEPWDGRYS